MAKGNGITSKCCLMVTGGVFLDPFPPPAPFFEKDDRCTGVRAMALSKDRKKREREEKIHPPALYTVAASGCRT